MRRALNTYTAFSVMCFVVWAVILTIYATLALPSRDSIYLIFGGWVLGWLTATIARYVYPSPERQGGSPMR